MIPPLKPGARLLQVDGPVLETERLVLRPWRSDDIEPNTAMLSDAGTARFIVPDGKPVRTALDGWRNAAVMAGHWALHGFGMFAVEEKSIGKYIGRVGPLSPPGWPGFEVGWGIAPEFAAEGMRSRRRVRRSIGCLQPSSSIRSFIASKVRIRPHRASRGGWGRGRAVKSICSASLPTFG